MMMINKNFLLTILFSSISGIIISQKSDFGIWGGVSATYRLDKHLEAKISASLRTLENTSKIDQYFAEIGIGYRFNDNFSCEGSYRIINKQEFDTVYHFRHKLFFNIKGTLPAGRFLFSSRLMYQKTMKAYIEDANDMIPRHYARLKLKTSYSGPTSPFRPFVSFEPFVPIFNDSGFKINKSRSSAGIEIKISNRSSFETAYIFEKVNSTGVPAMHIFSMNYDLVF
jgi:hypothetical protein